MWQVRWIVHINYPYSSFLYQRLHTLYNINSTCCGYTYAKNEGITATL